MDSDLNEAVRDDLLRKQNQNLSFVIVGSLGALVWDILSNLKYEYHLLQGSRWSLSTVVYLLARTTTVAGFVLGALIFGVHGDACTTMLYASSWMTSASIASTTLLFFFRVRAVYNNDRYITGVFFLLWLCVFGLCIYQPLKGEIPSDSPNTLCSGVTSNLVTLVVSMSTVPMGYDILGFFAVAWRLFRNTHVAFNFKDGFRVIMLGKLLPHFSRALLRDSQLYFLSTAVLGMLTTILFYSSSKLSRYSTLFVFPNIALMNLMGCRIYRHTKLQLGKYTASHAFSSIGFLDPASGPNTDADMTNNLSQLSKHNVQPTIFEKQEDENITTAR